MRLKQLEDEGNRKDRVIAKLTLEAEAMRDLIQKKAGALAAASRGENVADARPFDGAGVRVDMPKTQI